jgi:hypothetical protein
MTRHGVLGVTASQQNICALVHVWTGKYTNGAPKGHHHEVCSALPELQPLRPMQEIPRGKDIRGPIREGRCGRGSHFYQ